jgi:hypothetical protein
VSGSQISFDPLLDPVLLGLFALAAVLALGLYLWRGGRAPASRFLLLAGIVLVLAGPGLLRETRAPVPAVGVIVIDRSPSMALSGRLAGADAALAALRERLAPPGGENRMDLRIVEVRGDADGTRIAGALDQALSGVPAERVAGAWIITDGRVVDAQDLARPFPIHQVLVGEAGERDRRVTLVAAPRTAVVGSVARLSVRVDDGPGSGPTAPLIVWSGEGEPVRRDVPVGETVTVEVPVDRRGALPLAIETPPAPGEISTANNAVTTEIAGVRERLRVLLVTGEPYAGARAWRNLLKADPSVDLVQFMILRSPDSIDFTPVEELALIAFPTEELFIDRLADFDLVIFDRFRRLDVLPDFYIENIARWIEEGGAFLMLAGPGESAGDGVASTPLGRLLPVRPTGRSLEGDFRPGLTGQGRTHPVTAPFAATSATWGSWQRVQASTATGTVLLEGPQGAPLLVLSQSGRGRLAAVMSDTAWLWQRGYQGGGPFDELFRRTAHWLMKEPDLDAERLLLRASGSELLVERRSQSDPGPAEVEAGGSRTGVPLRAGPDGVYAGRFPVRQPGLHRVRSGALTAYTVAGVGPAAESRLLTADGSALAGVVRREGGGRAAYVGRDGQGDPSELTARRARTDVTVALRREELIPPWAAGAVLLLLSLLAWVREGR